MLVHFPVFGSSFIMLHRHTCAEFTASSCPMVTRKENTKSYRHIVGQFSKGQHTSKATTALLIFSFGITQIQSVPTHAYHQQPVFVMEDCAHGPDNPALICPALGMMLLVDVPCWERFSHDCEVFKALG